MSLEFQLLKVGDPINLFNLPHFFCLFQASTWISNAICHCPCCVQ